MEEKQTKHSFGKGLLCGILLCVMILGVGGCAAPYLYGIFTTGRGHAGGALENEDGIIAKMEELNSYIEAYYLFDYTDEDVEDGIYKGMMAGLGDVYTCYYTPEEYASFMESSNGNYSGIGAMLSQDYNTGIITVVQVFEGSPAEEAGLQAEDILYKVKGEEVTGVDLSLVVTDLKGEEGTDVDISIVRGSEEIELTVTRRSIEVPTVESEMLTDTIGYIAITEFDDVTDDQFLEAMEELKAQGMEDLVIDLRNNGGGLVDVTCAILDELLPEGLIVYTEDKNGDRQEEYSDAEHYFSGNMAVLVNGNSASASEIFAGAIKDYGVGTLIGTQTFGKGIVQTLMPLSDGSAVKITISRYYTPAGNNIHEVGITPDIVLEQSADSAEDDQLKKAIEVLER
ncbi:MAG: S41 family peptidase [Eubacteriales bacterium]|nr:S41 family peptidase [Eubacteriales bacterium]